MQFRFKESTQIRTCMNAYEQFTCMNLKKMPRKLQLFKYHFLNSIIFFQLHFYMSTCNCLRYKMSRFVQFKLNAAVVFCNFVGCGT